MAIKLQDYFSRNNCFITCAGRLDGAGAQAHAILSVIVAARYLGFKYMHTPMERIDHNENNVENKKWVKMWETFFNFGEDELTVQEYKKKFPGGGKMHILDSLENIIKYPSNFIEKNQLLNGHIYIVNKAHCVIQKFIKDPDFKKVYHQTIADLQLRYSKTLKPSLLFYGTNSSHKKLEIAIHIRRGDVANGDRIITSKRFMNNDYFYRIMLNMEKIFIKMKINYQFHIFSEGTLLDDFPELYWYDKTTLETQIRDSYISLQPINTDLLNPKQIYSKDPSNIFASDVRDPQPVLEYKNIIPMSYLANEPCLEILQENDVVISDPIPDQIITQPNIITMVEPEVQPPPIHPAPQPQNREPPVQTKQIPAPTEPTAPQPVPQQAPVQAKQIPKKKRQQRFSNIRSLVENKLAARKRNAIQRRNVENGASLGAIKPVMNRVVPVHKNKIIEIPKPISQGVSKAIITPRIITKTPTSLNLEVQIQQQKRHKMLVKQARAEKQNNKVMPKQQPKKQIIPVKKVIPPKVIVQQKTIPLQKNIKKQDCVKKKTETFVLQKGFENPIKIHLNGDPIESLHHLVSADILVMAKSCYSFMAGLLNPNSIKFYTPFWFEPAYDEWIIVDENSDFNLQQFECELTKLI